MPVTILKGRHWPFMIMGLLILCTVPDTHAQQWQWPEKGENLKVLPENTTADQLSEIMRGFSRSLGVRCQYCHDDSRGTRLSQIDFPADTKETKEKARTMLRMVQAINGDHLAKLDVPEHERVAVTCITCHRGVPRPQMLENILSDLVPAHGVDSTVARYHELRERYYGGFAYDFSESMLRRLAEGLAEDGMQDEAARMLSLNLEMYPDSWQTHFMSSQIHLENGDNEAAIESLEAALALNPESGFLKQQLERLKSQ